MKIARRSERGFTERSMRVVVLLLIAASAAATMIWIIAPTPSWRGPVWSMGLQSGMLAVGMAFWGAVHFRSGKLAVCGALALVPLGYWAWRLYDLMMNP